MKRHEKLVYICDTHFANKPPLNRIDDYNDSIFNKLEYVLKYCKKNNINRLNHGGDLFHSYQINNQ